MHQNRLGGSGSRCRLSRGSHVLLSLLSLGASLHAQSTVVVPKGLDVREGNAVENRPFAFDRCRLSQLLGLAELNGLLPLGVSVQEIAYRRDGSVLPTRAMSRSSTPIWQIRAGNLLVTDVRDPSNNFLGPGDGMGGAGSNPDTLRIVFNAKSVAFPALAPTSSGLPAFQIRFKFDAPLLYVGGGLALDHYVYENSNRTHEYYVDAERSAVDSGSSLRYGTPCPADANRAHAIPSHPGGEPVQLLLLDGPQKPTIALGLIGTSNVQWEALPLPFDLTSIGLPGCALYCSQDVVLPLPTFSNGSAKILVPLAADPGLAGIRWYAQFIVIDDRVNPAFPVALSNGVEIRNGTSLGAGSGLQASFVFGTGNLANGRTGLRDIGITLVTEIVYQ